MKIRGTILSSVILLAALQASADQDSSCTFIMNAKKEDAGKVFYNPSDNLRWNYPKDTDFGAMGVLPESVTNLVSEKTFRVPPINFSTELLGTSPGATTMVTFNRETRSFKKYDLEKNTSQEITLPESLRSALGINSGSVVDPFSGSITLLINPSSDGKQLFLSTRSATYLVDLNHPEKYAVLPDVMVMKDYGSNKSYISPNGRFLEVRTKDFGRELYDLTDITHPKKLDITVDGFGMSEFVGNQYAWTTSDGVTHLKDLSTGAQTDFAKPSARATHSQSDVTAPTTGFGMGFNVRGGLPQTSALHGGDKLLIANPTGEFEVHDLKTGEVKTGEVEPFSEIKVSPDGERFAFLTGAQVQVVDADSGQVKAHSLDSKSFMNVALLNDGRIAYQQLSTGGASYRSTILSLDGACIPKSFRVIEDDCCKTGRGTRPLDQSQWIKEFMATNLCQADYNEATWKKFAPPVQSGELTEEQAEKLLLRFQKLDGFSPKEDLAALVAILRSRLSSKEPELVAGAMQSVFHQSAELYDGLFNAFPVLARLKPDTKSQKCRTKKEIEGLRQDAMKFFNSLKENYGQFGTIDNWNQLRPFSPILAGLSPAQKDDILDKIGDSLSNLALAGEYRNVFQSKLYKFAYQAAAPLVGEKQKPLTDLTLTRIHGGTLEPLIFSTDPIDGDPKTASPYGFYVRHLSKIEPKKFSQSGLDTGRLTAKWSANGQNFVADIDLKKAEIKDVVDQSRAPRYDEFWKDGKLTGIVVTGTNLRSDGAMVLDEYLSYYRSKGFKFDEPKKAIPDLKKFLEEKIRTGEGDYLIKEAHADGDEKNVFGIATKAEILTGKLNRPDGKKEIIYLVFPASGSGVQSSVVSNQEFGEWIKAREKSGQGQFVYFNTSCWGTTQAVNQVEAARSKKLLTIAATTEVETFTDESTSAEQILLTSFREGKSYEEMREALKENPGYSKKTENRFIFPDSDEYGEEITDRLIDTVDSKVTIKDQHGRPYFGTGH